MCWQFKVVFTDCPVGCSRWKTTEEHPAYGQTCTDFARTRQHCKDPILVIVGEKATKCPDHRPFGRYWNTEHQNHSSQVQASGMNPDPGDPTDTPNSSGDQLQSRSHQNPYSAHPTATQTEFRGGLQFNLSPRQQRGVWNNQASNSMYPDNNGVPPLGTYDRSSLSPDPPDLVVVSSSRNQQTNNQPENPEHWSTSNYPN